MSEQQWFSFIRLGKFLLMVIIVYLIIRLKAVWLPVLDLFVTALIPFLIAAFITYLLHPIIEYIHEKGIPRWLAILMIYFLFFGGVGYGIYKGVPLFIQQLKDLSESLPTLIETYRVWTRHIHNETSAWPVEIHTRIETMLAQTEQLVGNVLTMVLNGIKRFVNSAVVFALIPFIVFYMLKDIDQIKKAVWYVTPKRWRSPGLAFLKDVDESLGNYIRGQLFVGLLIGIVATIALWLVGMDYPLLLGFIIGATNIIPYFGPIIGAIPAVILAVTMSLKMVLIVTVIIFLLQFLEGNILSPLIVGKSLHMHPLVIMFALFLGGEIAGVIGLIVAVPFVAVLKVAILHVKEHFSPR
ncbi:AI-2E family transporter [Thermaerobacillus caldiproteolyticus]|uniref:AI-2E family transporter n=1 Tax=Thermaerobacillus caldiproteolyticus TaxID=247480 RepID=UPI00188B2B71|nr:AI-2E family transporter [Anoxybacillus caldiproteolyticus]QPA30179.1 AI-2E family transporter [Anoxybacillus caldiproteolyticus]